MSAAKQSQGDGPRVLIIAATDRRRGAEVFTERLEVGLTGHGWVVDAVSLTSSGEERRAGIECLTEVDSSHPGRLNRRIARALTQRIRDFQPDLVLANGGSTLRYAALATLTTKPPLVYVAIGEPNYWIRSGLARMANRWMLRRAARVFAVCEATARQLQALEPSLAGKVDVTYTGVPDEMFRSRSGGDVGPLRVAVVGSLSDEKDPLLALESVAPVPEAVVRFVGSGPLVDRVRGEAETMGMGERVELTGAVDDITPHLEWASVLLVTSRTEGLPAAILEAGALSVPAVAVDVGGVREAIADEETGIVVERRDVAALVGALTRFAADPHLVSQMGEAARAHVQGRFALEGIISGYSDRLSEVLG